MQAKIIKELLWILGTVTLTILVGLWIFAGRLFDPGHIDIQLHDTYFVFPKAVFLAVVFIFLVTATYLSRGIYFKFNNRVVNGVLAFFLFASLVLELLYLKWVNNLESHLRVVYERDMDSEIQSNIITSYRGTKSGLLVLLSITVAFLVLTTFNTVRKKGK